MTDWLSKVHASRFYFINKTRGISPNKLLVNPKVRNEISAQIFRHTSFADGKIELVIALAV